MTIGVSGIQFYLGAPTMKTNIFLAIFSFLQISYADQCDSCLDVKVPPVDTLEYYQFLKGVYDVVQIKEGKEKGTVQLDVRDHEKGLPLEIIQADEFKESFELSKKVTIRVTELPSKTPGEKVIHLEFIGTNQWGIKTFKFETYRTIKVPEKKELPRRKRLYPDGEQMLANIPPFGGFYLIITMAGKSSCQLPPKR